MKKYCQAAQACENTPRDATLNPAYLFDPLVGR
jgi:hypothetical protein